MQFAYDYLILHSAIHLCLFCLCDCSDPCSLPMTRGPCDTYQPRWYYDYHSGSCQEFVFGGCQGNDNKFNSKAECRKKCQSDAGTRSIVECYRPIPSLRPVFTQPRRNQSSDTFSVLGIIFCYFVCNSIAHFYKKYRSDHNQT